MIDTQISISEDLATNNQNSSDIAVKNFEKHCTSSVDEPLPDILKDRYSSPIESEISGMSSICRCDEAACLCDRVLSSFSAAADTKDDFYEIIDIIESLDKNNEIKLFHPKFKSLPYGSIPGFNDGKLVTYGISSKSREHSEGKSKLQRDMSKKQHFSIINHGIDMDNIPVMESFSEQKMKEMKKKLVTYKVQTNQGIDLNGDLPSIPANATVSRTSYGFGRKRREEFLKSTSYPGKTEDKNRIPLLQPPPLSDAEIKKYWIFENFSHLENWRRNEVLKYFQNYHRNAVDFDGNSGDYISDLNLLPDDVIEEIYEIVTSRKRKREFEKHVSVFEPPEKKAKIVKSEEYPDMLTSPLRICAKKTKKKLKKKKNEQDKKSIGMKTVARRDFCENMTYKRNYLVRIKKQFGVLEYALLEGGVERGNINIKKLRNSTERVRVVSDPSKLTKNFVKSNSRKYVSLCLRFISMEPKNERINWTRRFKMIFYFDGIPFCESRWFRLFAKRKELEMKYFKNLL